MRQYWEYLHPESRAGFLQKISQFGTSEKKEFMNVMFDSGFEELAVSPLKNVPLCRGFSN